MISSILFIYYIQNYLMKLISYFSLFNNLHNNLKVPIKLVHIRFVHIFIVGEYILLDFHAFSSGENRLIKTRKR